MSIGEGNRGEILSGHLQFIEATTRICVGGFRPKLIAIVASIVVKLIEEGLKNTAIWSAKGLAKSC